jgi:uncharacterized protein DUF4384
MRSERQGLSRLAIALVVVASSACASSSQRAQTSPVQTGSTSERVSRRELRDSAVAQAIADMEGPGASIRADFSSFGGSRRVEASFRMNDDAYVVVGHLDAGGRLQIVFPTDPSDDGFVKGGKSYRVPAFFAGFTGEYAYQRSVNRYRYQSMSSRLDSYDGGQGYVFLVASWRPMRLDRISDGGRWQTYEITDISYMSDPREAVEELAAAIAADNREAYTVRYADYRRSNYGAFSTASLFNFGGRGYCQTLLGYDSFYSIFDSYESSYYGCGSSRYYNTPRFGFGYAGYTPRPTTPVTTQPPTPGGTTVVGSIDHRPRQPGDQKGTVTDPSNPEQGPRTEPRGEDTDRNSGIGLRRRGLVATDMGGTTREQPVRASSGALGIRDRPRIQDMLGHRDLNDPRARAGVDGGRTANAVSRGAPRDADSRGAFGGASSWERSRTGMSDGSRSRPADGGSYGGASNHGSSGASARSEPRSQPHTETTRSAPSMPTHVEPTRTETPRAQPSSSPPQVKPEPSGSGERKPKPEK